jgi:predicted kinase
MPIIAVPDPSLVVLVAAAGAGKSTFAARHFAPDEVLSSDAYRAVVGRGEADQRATRAAFSALHRDLARRLAAGRLSVVDATSLERHARTSLLRLARAARVPAVAIVLDLPERVVLSRNLARRPRSVDPDVVSAHLRLLRRAVDRGLIEAEGFDDVYRIRSPLEVDAVVIARRRQRSAAGARVVSRPARSRRR